ncbi:DUF3566 domain-containing protein [Modestobacter excelsi]|uniref:DUF3566 domain-containing protein n=1 Tax=Modestobacter excelsi TaxID=2213161 RepID=UPI001C20EC02|nr:DUF3566 domain-containing protein [Modestobacter excelsi]
MSDRGRSSVRTGTRSGSGTSDGVPEVAAPVDAPRDREAAPSPAGATVVGSPPAGTRAASSPAPAESTEKPDATVRARIPDAAPTQAPVSTTKNPVSTTKAPAKGADAPAPPAAHPVTPLGPTATPAPPVPPVTGTNRAVRGQGPLPVDATQAVTVSPVAARPPDTSSRPATRTPDGDRSSAEATARTGKVRGAGRGPRRARLQLRHIDTWSALKISLVVSIALFFVWMIAVAVLYGVLGGLGVFDTLNDLIGQLSSSSGEAAGSGGDVISGTVVLGGAAVIGAVNIVLLTALCTVAAFVYNLCSDLVGGLEVTLAERD